MPRTLAAYAIPTLLLAPSPLPLPANDPPLGSSPAWVEPGGELWSWYGFDVLGIGDVNGDGIDDVAISAPLHDGGLEEGSNRGSVAIWHGTGGQTPGPGTEPYAGVVLEFDTLLIGDDNGGKFGEALGSGDFDGDGFCDLAVGAPNHGDGFAASGRVFVYFGGSSGLATMASQLPGAQPGSRFGAALASAGDVDGDGDDELLIGAPFFDGTSAANVGRAELFDWDLSTSAWRQLASFEGTKAQSQAGFAVAGLGDIQGDGLGDFAVGAPDLSDATYAGRVYVFEGRSELSQGSATEPLELTPDWTTTGSGGEQLGYALGGLGDLNGDGLDDFAIGAPFFDGEHANQGCVYLVSGSAEGLGDPVPVALGAVADETLGRRIGGAGDVNQDGCDEVLIVSGHEHAGNTGALHVWSVPQDTALNWTSIWIRAGAHSDGWLGGAFAGDLNADGYEDVIAGEWGADLVHVDEGRALVFLGRSGSAFSSYCESTVNSTGFPATIDPAGQASLTSGNIELHASPVPPGVGLFFFGDREAQLPFWDGWLCVSGALQRGPLHLSHDGVLSDALGFSALPYLIPGSIWNFQAWFRDALSTTGANLSNAVHIAIEP